MGTTTSVFDRVSGLLSGGFVLGQLSELIKLDAPHTRQVVDRTIALLIGALADRLEDAPEPEMMDRLVPQPEMWVLSDVSRHVLNPHAARGGEVVAAILGESWENHVGDLATANRLGPRQFAHLVNRVAPVVVAGVAEQRRDNDLDAEKLALMLAYERDRLTRIGLLSAAPGPEQPDDDETGVAADARSTSERLVRSTRNVAKVRAPATSVGRSPSRPARLPASWMWWAAGTAALVFLLAWVLSRSIDSAGTQNLATDTVDPAETEVAADADSTDQAANGSTADDAGSTGAEDAVREATASSRQGSVEEPGEGEVLGESSLPDEPTGSSTAADDGSTQGDAGETGDGADAPEGVPSGTSLNELLELDTVTFRILSSVVTNDGLRVIDQVIEYLSAHPLVRVEIGGHTDNDGSDAKNLKLSQARADAVARYIESHGIEADRLDPVGYGEAEPKVPNDSTVNKAVNRRIEFTVL